MRSLRKRPCHPLISTAPLSPPTQADRPGLGDSLILLGTEVADGNESSARPGVIARIGRSPEESEPWTPSGPSHTASPPPPQLVAGSGYAACLGQIPSSATRRGRSTERPSSSYDESPSRGGVLLGGPRRDFDEL